MRKYAETLVNYSSWIEFGKPFVKRCGNHAVKLNPASATFLNDKTGKDVKVDYPNRVFTYHENVICIVSDYDKAFWLSHAGWFTPSTSQALNQYREFFKRRGYTCMTD